ncbi:MAG TPA: hypothetical protein VFK02_11070 [Kofleriaceae bacterium]|nr:hypothetical protein [Kofleriaceae bacterium]
MKLVAWVVLVCLVACGNREAPPSGAPPVGSAAGPAVAAPKPSEPAPATDGAKPAEPPKPSKPSGPPPGPDTGFLVAAYSNLTQQFFIARVTPKAVTDVYRDASAPQQVIWLDGHVLVTATDEPAGKTSDNDTVLRWFVDGTPDERHGGARGERIAASVWPAGFRDASTRLAVTRSGQLWLGRLKMGGSPEQHTASFVRADAAPYQPQPTPPADLDLARSNEWPASRAVNQVEERARRDRLPHPASGPRGMSLARKKVARGIPGVECRDGKRLVKWPTAGTHPFLRLHVEDAHWLSETLPVWIAVGHNPDFPDGDIVNAEVFLGCSKEPLADLRWLGGDLWATLEAGSWSRPEDARRWTLWNGATRLAVLDATSAVFEAAPW